MGKESKLKKRPGETRYQYSNGDRKLYDRDACPQGADEVVWHLALYFRQCGEDHGWAVEGIPILYTELYHRISSDPDLTSILAPDIMGGKGGSPVTGDTDGTTVLEDMIQIYFNEYSSHKPPSINDFCNYSDFNNLKNFIIKGYYHKSLVITGTRVTQSEGPVKPDRRKPGDKEVVDITLRNQTEEEIKSKFDRFREGS